MQDLKTALIALPYSYERADIESVLRAEQHDIHETQKASWHAHLLSKAIQYLNETHKFLALTQDREQQARLTNLIKLITETRP